MLPGLSIDQSARWGELVQHYAQHRKADPTLSFTDFIAMHYGANSEHQKHPKHSHHNLPSAGHSVSVYAPGALRLIPAFTQQVVIALKTTFSHKADLYSFLAVFGLINPPRR